MADKNSDGIGRLEVYHDEEWGTICNDFFDRNAIKVACRELGFTVADDDIIELYHLTTGRPGATVRS